MSKCELIELKDLSVNDPIELAPPATRKVPPPVNPVQPSHFHVVRMVGDSVTIEAPWCQTREAAVGHDFQPYSYTHLTWCDLCGEFIWGVYKQSLRCASEYLTVPLQSFYTFLSVLPLWFTLGVIVVFVHFSTLMFTDSPSTFLHSYFEFNPFGKEETKDEIKVK